MRVLAFIYFVMVRTRADAQWTMQESNTTASLRGIDNVGGGVAWASGTDGTVIRTSASDKAARVTGWDSVGG